MKVSLLGYLRLPGTGLITGFVFDCWLSERPEVTSAFTESLDVWLSSLKVDHQWSTFVIRALEVDFTIQRLNFKPILVRHSTCTSWLQSAVHRSEFERRQAVWQYHGKSGALHQITLINTIYNVLNILNIFNSFAAAENRKNLNPIIIISRPK